MHTAMINPHHNLYGKTWNSPKGTIPNKVIVKIKPFTTNTIHCIYTYIYSKGYSVHLYLNVQWTAWFKNVNQHGMIVMWMIVIIHFIVIMDTGYHSERNEGEIWNWWRYRPPTYFQQKRRHKYTLTLLRETNDRSTLDEDVRAI